MGLLPPRNPIGGFTWGVAKEKVKLLLVVSANSLDSVERSRQTPSDEAVSLIFAEVVGLMIRIVNGVFQNRSVFRWIIHVG